MLTLRDEQFVGGEGMYLKMDRFYNTWDKFLKKNEPRKVTSGVQLTLKIAPLYSAIDKSPYFMNKVMFEGSVAATTKVPIPLTTMGAPLYLFSQEPALKKNLLKRVKEVWTQTVGVELGALPKEIVEGGKKYYLYALTVQGEITFNRLLESGERESRTFTTEHYLEGNLVEHTPGFTPHILVV